MTLYHLLHIQCQCTLRSHAPLYALTRQTLLTAPCVCLCQPWTLQLSIPISDTNTTRHETKPLCIDRLSQLNIRWTCWGALSRLAMVGSYLKLSKSASSLAKFTQSLYLTNKVGWLRPPTSRVARLHVPPLIPPPTPQRKSTIYTSLSTYVRRHTARPRLAWPLRLTTIYQFMTVYSTNYLIPSKFRTGDNFASSKPGQGTDGGGVTPP